MQIRRITFCTHEDREAEYQGVAVLATTLLDWVPAAQLVVFGRNAPDWFFEFAKTHPSLHLRVNESFEAVGFSLKPEVLARLLGEGHERVVWLDTDIAVTSDIEAWFAHAPESELIVAEEPNWARLQENGSRAEGWGLTMAREFSPSLNSCVVGVTRAHRSLLDEWVALMRSDVYLTAQRRQHWERPAHVASDQEVLHALLSSVPFSHIPVRILRSDIDVAQCHMADGYSPHGRLRHVWGGLPPIVHSQGFKPWHWRRGSPSWRDVSPYVYAVRRHPGLVDRFPEWTRPRSLPGRVLIRVLGDEPNLPGLPAAALQAAQRALRIRTRLRRWIGRTS